MHYIIWTFIALVIGVVYMRLLLGNIPDDESYEGIGFIVQVIYVYGLVKVGLLIGGIIATLFILLDALYLKRKLNSDLKSVLVRLGALISITFVVGIVHYILEKVIDII